MRPLVLGVVLLIACRGKHPDLDGDGVIDAAYGGSDCDDGDASTYPGAVDTPDDGVDQDCTGRDAVTCAVDNDGDGFGDELFVPEDEDCDDEGESFDAGDCDDRDPSAYPGAPEDVCGEDLDCDGSVTECEGKGCGCATGGSAPGLLVGGVSLLAALRRRRA